MRLFYSIFLLTTLLGTELSACLNHYFAHDTKGHLHQVDDYRKPFNKNFDLKKIERELRTLEQKMLRSSDFRLLSDYAVLLLKAGKTTEAVDIFEQLVLTHPEEYQLASNLGTAYELNGQVEKAWKFIKKGMELNPDAHEGSEWVHLRILETKMALAKDSNYLSSNTVLQLTEEQKKDAQIRNQIIIQLRERFPFSPQGNNPIMASIFIGLAQCFEKTISIEFAIYYYHLASQYYGADEGSVSMEIVRLNKLREEYKDIRPEPVAEQGMNIMVGTILNSQMLENKNIKNYQVKWAKVLLEVDSLLTLVAIERQEIVEKIEPKVDSFSMEEENSPRTGPEVIESSTGESNMKYWWMAVVLLFCIALGAMRINKKIRMKYTIQYSGIEFPSGTTEVALDKAATIGELIDAFNQAINKKSFYTIMGGAPPFRREMEVEYSYRINKHHSYSKEAPITTIGIDEQNTNIIIEVEGGGHCD